MARIEPGGADDFLKKSEAVLAAPGAVTPWESLQGSLNLHVTGAFVGTYVVDRSFDGGATFAACSDRGQVIEFSGPASEVLEAFERNMLFRIRCTALDSGEIVARLSQ
jgi:hypothetical protein